MSENACPPLTAAELRRIAAILRRARKVEEIDLQAAARSGEGSPPAERLLTDRPVPPAPITED